MTEDKWIELLERIDRQFTMLDRTIEDVPMGPGEIESVVFEGGPMGRLKIERTVKPVVLDKKQHFSNRSGAGTTTEYTYSDTEKSDRVRLYKFNERTDEWDEIDATALTAKG